MFNLNLKKRLPVAAALALMAAAPTANAVMPVVDVRAIVQMVQQLQTMRNQLETARSQLIQAQNQYNAMTGARGMERLLNSVPRNYLPPSWVELERVLRDASSTYNALAATVRSITESNAVLTPRQLGTLSPASRELLEGGRQSAAMMQAVGRDALQATSDRFGQIQQLIDAIPRATDPKAIQDLHTRSAIENIMVLNEQNKLIVMNQIAQAEEQARVQRARERAIADIGSLRDLPPMGL